MVAPKIKVVLDADVIIHFTKGGMLDMLPKILPGYKFDLIEREKTITEETFGKTPQEIKEYARLISSLGPALGRGESACMVYCRYHHDVVGSSNTKDITDYCNEPLAKVVIRQLWISINMFARNYYCKLLDL